MRYAPILIALAVASTARAEGDRTLHLAVHGSIDGPVVAQALATELGVDVALVSEACDLPCLDIALDGAPDGKHTATISFAPRSGSPRARSVELGTDTAHWPLVITLLAGNVVRDEAQDVLAGLPPRDLPRPRLEAPPGDVPLAPEEAPPAPAPRLPGPADPRTGAPTGPITQPGQLAPPAVSAAAPPPAEPEPAREHSWLGLGFVPGLSTDLSHIGSVQHFLSLDLLVGVSGGSSGLSMSGIADIERGMVAGFQIAGVVAVARGLSAGFQIGGVVAVSRRVVGTQVAGVAAVAGGDASFQLGGVTSVSRGTANIQIAGVVNVARRVRGVQLAPINVAHDVDGLQIGVINVGGSADGFSFGLINIVPGGRYDLETAIDTNQTGTILFRHGGRRWHNVYGVGGHPVKETGPSDDVWMYGLGFGPSLSFDDTVIDLEAIGWQVNHGPRHESDVSVLGQLRLSIAHRWGPFAIVAGGVFNAYVTNDPESPLYLERRASGSTMSTGTTVTTWPSAFIGVRI
ncbi:MAG TPA: hypothetical protein VFT22_08830 [Kofleriaceae bacterium]|nr:hypothetical protein [Kofleriaceae bacterium]